MTTWIDLNTVDEGRRYIVAALLFTFGVCGIAADLFAIRCILKHHYCKNCFGRLQLLHSTVEAVILSGFLFWAVPITLT
uniref:7TM GPCR serpentine receptor class x (Srx) domain-containing protein n=1 Tax=Panagrolaimus sp. JU765 TaxID=591449 RepID=A0AC34Q3B4_9BILA